MVPLIRLYSSFAIEASGTRPVRLRQWRMRRSKWLGCKRNNGPPAAGEITHASVASRGQLRKNDIAAHPAPAGFVRYGFVFSGREPGRRRTYNLDRLSLAPPGEARFGALYDVVGRRRDALRVFRH